MWFRIVCAAACVAVLAGCGSLSQPEFLEPFDVPRSGGLMPAEVWEALEEGSSEGRPEAQSQWNTLWAIPFQFAYAQTTLYSSASEKTMADGSPRAETAQTFRIDWNDLFMPYLGFALPLRVIVYDYGYEKGTAEPVRKRGIGYTPFWAWTWDNGAPRHEALEYKAAGVPLIYWQMSGNYRAPGSELAQVKLDVYQGLWTLGPSAIKLDMNLDGDEVGGYLANPLLLGGFLGYLVWTDYTFRAPGRYSAGHGPFVGLLGYTNQTYPRANGASGKLRFAVAGVLWSEYMEKIPDGRVIDSKRGPLWSMFGWGRKDGRFAIRALWQTIPIGHTPDWAMEYKEDQSAPTPPESPQPAVEPVDQKTLSAAW